MVLSYFDLKHPSTPLRVLHTVEISKIGQYPENRAFCYNLETRRVKNYFRSIDFRATDS